MNRVHSSLPFFNLHSHDGLGSPYDGMGFPKEHMEFVWQNGMDGMAFTNHGNMSSFSFQREHAIKMNKEGRVHKPVYGVEAYYIDDLEEWKLDYEKAKEDKKRRKELEKEKKGIVFEEEERGVTGKIRGNAHFLLLAQSKKGLHNLFRLVSESNNPNKDYFWRKPRIDFNLLKENSEDIITSTTCISGVFAKIIWSNPELSREELKTLMRPYLWKFLELFGNNRFFGELQWNNIPQQHTLNQCIIELSQENNMKLISTVDSHYPTPESWKERELLKRLGFLSYNKKPEWIDKPMPKTTDEIGYELYPKNGDQVFESFKKYSKECNVSYDSELIKQSIKNTYEIAHELIGDVEIETTISLPSFVRKDTNRTPDEELRSLAEKGLREKQLDTKQNYVERLNEELDILKERNFSEYFLATLGIVEKGSEIMLLGNGRGSAAGSLIAYVLDITKIDPIEWNLLFSRFLSKFSSGMPDIDLDFSDNDKMKDVLVDDWGSQNVALISNWNRMKVKSLLKDIAKFYEVPFEESNSVTKVMDEEAVNLAKQKNNITAGLYHPTWKEYKEFSPTLQKFIEKYPDIDEFLPKLLGEVRSVGTHAAGLVLSENLNEKMPLIRRSDKEKARSYYQTPFSEGQAVRHLEPLGFIKFDILGLESLAMIEDCIRQILQNRYGVDNPTFQQIKQFYNENLHPNVINHNDKEVYKSVFHEGKWVGIFQFTQSGAQKYCQQVKPLSIEDGSAITSNFRPGPLGIGAHEVYDANKKNPKKIKYFHKLHKEVVENTYGVLVYQEQIAELCYKLSKTMTLDDGNNFRKLLTKKGLSEDKMKKLNEYKRDFLEGCIEKGVSKNNAEDLLNSMISFAFYGFNRSHAISYFFTSYQCAWLLHYYEPEWCCAFLNKEKEENKQEAISIVKGLGYKIVSPNINKSQKTWAIIGKKTISQPLGSIKGLGDKAIEQLLKYRPFDNVEEFLFHHKMSYRSVNKKVVDALLKAGALDELMDERFKTKKHFYLSLTEPKPNSQKPHELDDNIEEHKNCGEFTRKEKIEHILSTTGNFPFDLVISNQKISNLKNVDIPMISDYNKEEVVWFVVVDVLERTTKTNKEYWILKCIDPGGTTEVKCWGINQFTNKPVLYKPYICEIQYQDKWGFSVRNLNKNIKAI